MKSHIKKQIKQLKERKKYINSLIKMLKNIK